MPIIISKDQQDAVKVSKAAFKDEDFLQKYIHDNPDVIPLYEIDEDIRILILAREYPTQSGPIDAIGIDQEGNVYLIETKLYKNPDKRTVVAQVLDYGASLWKHSLDFSEFSERVGKQVQKNFDCSLSDRIKAFYEIDEDETTELLENVSNSLNKGYFKFVVLMDQLHERLKDLVLFINQNSNFDIFAVEIEYYQHENMEIMIPKVFGNVAKKNPGKSKGSANRKTWTEEELFEDAAKKMKASSLKAFRKLYEFCKDSSDQLNFGSGKTCGSFSPFYDKYQNTVFTMYSTGGLVFNFCYEKNDPNTPDIVKKYRKRINQIGITLKNEENQYPATRLHQCCAQIDDIISVVSEMFIE